MHHYKTAWYSIRPPVSTHDFGDISSCEVWRLQRGGTGRAGALEDGNGKEGEPKASGVEQAGNIDHTAITVNLSKARRTRQVVDTGPTLTNFASINCTFT